MPCAEIARTSRLRATYIQAVSQWFSPLVFTVIPELIIRWGGGLLIMLNVRRVRNVVVSDSLAMTDVCNISVVQNDSDTYKVKVYNVESKINMFPIVPDSVTCHPGEQKPTGDMWTCALV